MSQNIDLQSTWEELEKETDGKVAGICKRIASRNANFRIYLGINSASKAKLFIMEFPIEDTWLFDDVTSSKGLLLDILTKGDLMAGCNACVAVSNDTKLNSIFTSFAQDLINVAQQLRDRKHYTAGIVRRLKLWKAFFENTGGQGLSQEKQIGLFGELDILEQLIVKTDMQVIQYWKGPGSGAQDFQFEMSALEVKSTINEYKTSVLISNIKQLDKENRNSLYLCFIHYEALLERGISLPAMVDRILQLIIGTKWADAFEEKLLGLGYYAQDAPKYKIGYIRRSTEFFDTADPFPKIVRQNIACEIIDVSYSIDLSQCTKYAVDFETICAQL
jgi:hypothetical protein